MEADLTGVVLDGRYRVIEPISEGAMGVVYRGERLKLGRIVAIKVMHDQLPAELSSRQRFETEATAMAKLEHPHCAAVIDVGIHDDKPFVVMDYVAGETLRDIVAEGPLPLTRAVEIVRQVLSGLAHAHEQGIIHRDIKPANIVVSQKSGLGDHVKILDFGLARITDAPKVTTGIVVGTPAYMAPEQIRGTEIDHRADLYAAGVLLFELLTAAKPFVSPTDDPVEVCSMHLKHPPPTLAAKQPGIEFGELEAIVAKALSKHADDRYASAGEFAAALGAVYPRRATAPVIPVPTVATESGWIVAPNSAPVPVPSVNSGPTVPTVAPEPVVAPTPAVATTPTVIPSVESAPVVGRTPTGQAGPAGPPAPIASRPARSTKAPPAPFASRSKSPTVKPVFNPQASLATAADAVAAVEQARPNGGLFVGGLPADFDLSIAIPRDALGANATALSSGVELSMALPQPVQPAKGETKLGLGAVDPSPEAKPHLRGLGPDQKEIAHDATAFFQGAPPAGPSPLATTDVPAVAEAVSLPPPPTLPSLPVTRKHMQIAGIVVGALILLAIIIGTCSGGGSKAPASQPTNTTQAPTSSSGPVPSAADAQFARATESLDEGKPKAAIETLLTARSEFPRDVRFSYLLGRAYFETKQTSAGLTQFRDTLALDGTYRADPLLIRTVVGAFNSAPEYPADVGAFLRDEIGPSARQYLEEAATKHASPKIRARAKAELSKLR